MRFSFQIFNFFLTYFSNRHAKGKLTGRTPISPGMPGSMPNQALCSTFRPVNVPMFSSNYRARSQDLRPPMNPKIKTMMATTSRM
jgi:hypothetical protein